MLACGLLTYMRNACLHRHTHTKEREMGGGTSRETLYYTRKNFHSKVMVQIKKR